jgi:serine kinase of HPr protein (carbohydrate metabolism regulator)
MMKKSSLEEIFQGKIVKLGINEIVFAAGWEKELSKINIRLINRIPFPALKKNAPAIAIINSRVLSKSCKVTESFYRQMPDNILRNNIVFLILADSLSIPASLKNISADRGIHVAASKYNEHYLRSLLQALLREKFQSTISVHGVILEAKGKGVLITGASGIGKTTAALKTITKEDYWVADDIAVIKRNNRGELIAGGHKKIRNYIHTEVTGIVPVCNLLQIERIKKNTKLAVVVDVEKGGNGNISSIKGKKEILGVELTCLHINIPLSGYFDENLLKKALRQLSEEDD